MFVNYTFKKLEEKYAHSYLKTIIIKRMGNEKKYSSKTQHKYRKQLSSPSITKCIMVHPHGIHQL